MIFLSLKTSIKLIQDPSNCAGNQPEAIMSLPKFQNHSSLFHFAPLPLNQADSISNSRECTIGRTQELPQVKGDSNQDPNHESNLESNEQTLWSPGSSIEEDDEKGNANFQSVIQTNDTAVDDYAFARKRFILKNYHSVSNQNDSKYKHYMNKRRVKNKKKIESLRATPEANLHKKEMSFHVESTNADYSLCQDVSQNKSRQNDKLKRRSVFQKNSPNRSSNSKYHNHGLCLLSISPSRLPNNSNYYCYQSLRKEIIEILRNNIKTASVPK